MKMRQSITIALLTVICLLSNMRFVNAQRQTEPVVQSEPIENITITASRSHMAISQIPATVWVINNEQLSREIASGVDLKNMLGKLIPSLDFGNENRTNFSQNLRGRRALVMIDGISLNSTRQISRQLESIDPFNINRIEVLSGATSIYGAGAAGGIINIITKNANNTTNAQNAEALLSITSGLNNSDDLNRKLGIAGYVNDSSFSARLALGASNTRGAFDADGTPVFPDITQTDTQFNDTLDAQLNMDYRIHSQSQLSFMGQFYESEQDSDSAAYLGPNLIGLFGFPEFIEIRDGLQLDAQPRTQRHAFHLQYSHQKIFGQQFLAQFFYRKEAFRFYPFPFIFRVQGSPFPGNAFPVFGSSEQSTEVAGTKLVLVKSLDNGQLTYGVDIDNESFDAQQRIYDIVDAFGSGGLLFNPIQTLQRYPDIDSKHYAVFAQLNQQFNRHWSITGGFRYQHTEHDVGDFTGLLQQHLDQLGFYPASPDVITGGSNDYSEWLANLGAVYHLSADQQFWANFSQGFDLPDPARYYGQGRYNGLFGEGPTLLSRLNVSDNPLSGVKTDALELGWRRSAERYQLQLSAYYSLSDKTTSFDPANLSIQINDDERRIYGIEGQIDFDISDRIYTSLQAHFLSSHTKVADSWRDLAAEEASPDTATFRVGYRHNNLGLELQIQRIWDYQDENAHRLEGYQLAHLNGFYQLPLGQVSFGIQNLFDKQYQTLWSQRAQIIYGTLSTPELFNYAGQGTRFSLSYELTF
ncbi:TonB-dependent receptor [Alteromonas sp. a30]|uniref:TonB-dependent receptor n=1 Tax=Alteromonas sp. a30 TaxID=2730917 RepID=UPI00227EB519|nr:TonB-dependent receptor [Alteromonas sp. a30]MCY7295178.1 TonB-dependent receptor [Alteromonas sp. a30]